MNFSNFKQWLGADPYARESETIQAGKSDPSSAAAAREAEGFEHKLESAIRVEAPEDLLASILAFTKTETEKVAKPVIEARGRWILALAASAFMAVGAASVLLWYQQHRYSSVEDYVYKHMRYDGEHVLAQADLQGGVTRTQVNQVLQPFSATVSGDLLASIKFIKTCPTPNGKGAHFSISTAHGPMTVIFMPQTPAVGVTQFTIENQRVHVVPLEQGSIAIVGNNDQQINAVTHLLESGIQVKRVDI
ncbi:MAG: DUF3379 family protein [Xanthomonadales bacterium]|nr:DUF3379 family protein [Xanthomonadales bacterium]